MTRAGFVLAGGASSRMGRDKALLPFEGRTLLQHVAGLVGRAAGSVTVVAPQERYPDLGLAVIVLSNRDGFHAEALANDIAAAAHPGLVDFPIWT